ncbi:ribonuclease H-like domain-containing protein [Tanacetum coccineum]
MVEKIEVWEVGLMICLDQGLRRSVCIVKPIDCLSLNTLSISPIHENLSISLKDPQWRNAMYDEYNALVKNVTWIFVPRPTGVNRVLSMWLFKHKFHADRTLSRYKARLVANGSSQQLGIDIDETLSLVVKSATIRTVLSLVVSHKWPIHQLDVKNAFLKGDLLEIVYMHQPPGFIDPRYTQLVCLLQNSLYGLKQAPRAWFQRVLRSSTRMLQKNTSWNWRSNLLEKIWQSDRHHNAHPNLNKTVTKRICYILDCKKFSMEVCMHITHNVLLLKSPKSNLSSLRMKLAEDDMDENFIVGSRKLIHQSVLLCEYLAILLRPLNVTIEDVCDALLQGNSDTLGTELLASLLMKDPRTNTGTLSAGFYMQRRYKLFLRCVPLQSYAIAVIIITLRWKLGSCPTWSAADMTLDKVDYIKRETNQFFHCS